MRQKILILGSTGSIGTQTLEIIQYFPDLFQISGLSINTNIELLAKQCEQFSPDFIHIFSEEKYTEYIKKSKINSSKIRIFQGQEGLKEIVENTDFDLLINALSGEIGITPTLTAIKKKKNIALANKETLVAHGEAIMKLAKKNNVEIRPIDSEHSAIWQCLRGEDRNKIAKIILTCSGGPFRDSLKWPKGKLDQITPSQALKHPNWQMGQKISIDSATLMNKALEVIEAVRLFEISADQIEVVIHPQSIIHSAVEFIDGSIKAQMSLPDMRPAIALALSPDNRLPLPFPKFDFINQNLTFEKVDNQRFPSIIYAKKALRLGEKFCASLNHANEIAVADFLENKISFTNIFQRVHQAIDHK